MSRAYPQGGPDFVAEQDPYGELFGRSSRQKRRKEAAEAKRKARRERRHRPNPDAPVYFPTCANTGQPVEECGCLDKEG